MVNRWVVLALVLAGCGSEKATPAPSSGNGSSAAKQTGEIRVVVGDCAEPNTRFISTARPQALPTPAVPFPLVIAAEKAARSSQPDVTVRIVEESLNLLGGPDGGWGLGLRGTGQDAPTIGVGRYGTIGHSSSGWAKGVSSRRSMSVPQIYMSLGFSEGPLDAAIIRRYMKRNFQKLQYCYEKSLLAKPSLEGALTASFVIAPEGHVARSLASGVDDDVAKCYTDVVKSISFPKPKGGASVKTTFAFALRRDGKKDVKPATPKEHLDLSKLPDTVPTRSYDAPRPTIPTQDDAYKTGNDSPLRLFTNELVDCFRLQPQRHAALVIDIEGAIVKVHGLEDPSFSRCVRELASSIANNPKPMRCPIAFGTQPVGEAPGVDITTDAITVAGTKMLDAATALADTSSKWTFDAPLDAVKARVRAALDAKVPVAAHGPLVLRPLDTTPMSLVSKVAYSIILGGEDLVLAAQRGGSWQLLRPLVLPVVPVPIGTGIKWSAATTKFFGAERLAILVGRETVTITVTDRFGTSPQVTEVKAADAELMRTKLKEIRVTPAFASRSDLEIAGAHDATYGQVARVIDEAATIGFSSWSLTSPDALMAH